MSAENPAVPLSSLADGDDVWDALTEGNTRSGAKVTRKRTLGLSAVWRAVNLIANDLGRHTFRVYRYEGDGLADDPRHQAARVMRKPNDYMTPFTFRQILQAHALLSGNGYAYIFRDPNARPMELLPLDPDRTWPVRYRGELWYITQSDEPIPGRRRGAKNYVKIPASDMLHIKGLGFDGLVGYSVLKLLREAIGGALASRDYGARYFRNDASPGIVLICPASMKESAIVNLRKSWADLHQGFEKAHLPAILRDGVTLGTRNATNARDAQLLENRSFDARDIANIVGVPPHKVGDPSRTAYNSLESENQGYYEDTLGAWFTAWEQEADAKLLTELEKETESHCCRFDARPLARASIATKGAYFVQAIQNGWLNRDEVRAEEGRNPIPGGAGQVYMIPVNLAAAPGGMPAPAPAEPAPTADPAADPNAAPADGAEPYTDPNAQVSA